MRKMPEIKLTLKERKLVETCHRNLSWVNMYKKLQLVASNLHVRNHCTMCMSCRHYVLLKLSVLGVEALREAVLCLAAADIGSPSQSRSSLSALSQWLQHINIP